VITGRIRAPAGAILAAALIASDSPPALPRGTAASRPSPAVGCGISGQEPRRGAIMTAGTTSRSCRAPQARRQSRPMTPAHRTWR